MYSLDFLPQPQQYGDAIKIPKSTMKNTAIAFDSPPNASETSIYHAPNQMANIRHIVKSLPVEYRSLAAAIGLLATSGLNSHHVMRTLPDLLRQLMPIDIAGFFWANAEGEMIDAYVETPHFLRAEVVLSCMRFQAEAKGNWPSFQENVLAGAGAGYLQRYQTDHFYQSEHYQLAYAPIDIQHIIDVVVHDGNRPYGAFLLMRTSKQPRFNALEINFLRVITELLVYTYSLPVASNTPATRSYDAGILVLSKLGDIEFCNLNAHQILWMLSRDPATPMQIENDDGLPSLVRSHCSQGVEQARLHGGCQEHYSNHWGEFLLRYEASANKATVAVQMTQIQPYPCYLAKKIAQENLSPMRLMVAWLLSKGLSRKEIARRLEISPDTVAEYIKSIFDHFNISSTTELILKLSQ